MEFISWYRRMKINFSAILALICFYIELSVLNAGTEGQIRGRVSNMEGKSLAGAQVYIEELGIGAVADENGNYILLNVPVGTYDVTVEMIGYQTYIVENVNITMDQTTWLNFELSIAAIEGEVVYVTGERPLVEPGSTSKKIKELMKAVKEAGGDLEQEIKARKILKNYLQQTKEKGVS